MKKEETVDYHIKAAWHGISRMYNQGGAKEGVSASTGFVLLNIDKYDGTPATKIAPALGMEARSLTRLLKNMEESGLITRVQDPEDRRSVRIRLTEQGKEKRAFSKKAVILFNEAVREQISEHDLESFFKVMRSIEKVIDTNKNFDTKTILTDNE
ncbi:MarR family winged helix-turn-helix transcriptional regulator [Reichenbachiella versicolor]|uniref:MarR family winged helix-turn-helix transcriptional regulator n=1 Tax=Reichenbachiella versicolor TaxID=1821036 RepID=UPI000D6E07B5|nr:MarR family transcriptional regulator [Reichenbachiella versicolor]